MNVDSYAHSDIGRKRRQNEDSFLVDPDLHLYVVADGMGGHAAGDVASARCVEIVREQLVGSKHVLEGFAQKPTPGGKETVEQLMSKALQAASRDIYRLAERETEHRGMGTTCVAFLVLGKKAVIGHVGDSRIYLRRNGRVHQLTEDHSLVQEQIKRGIITREQAEKSEVRNVITRAIGLQASVDVDTLVLDVTPGDVFLLCSDGLHGYTPDDAELNELLATDPRTLPKRLIDLANQRGGKDNITAIVVAAEGGAQSTAANTEAADVEAKTEILRRIPLFQYMNYKELVALLSISQARPFNVGDEIIREGDTGDEMYVLFRGRVTVSKGGAAITELRSGGHFGELGLVDHAPRSATVTAVESTHVISIGRDALLKLMKKESLLAVKLLWSFVQVLGERLRNTNEALSGLKDEVERLRGETLEEVEELPPPPPPFGDD